MHTSKGRRDGPIHNTMHEAIEDDISLLKRFGVQRCAIQVFAIGPQSSKVIIHPEEYEHIKKITAEDNNFKLVVHGSYLDFPWKGKHFPIINIVKEMKIANHIGATGVIVHLGSGAADPAMCTQVMRNISAKLSNNVKNNCILWLEINPALPTSHTFETPEKLIALFDIIEKAKCDLRVGLCIDTAHLHSCGVPLHTRKDATTWLAKIDILLDRGIPIMVHLNDSKSIFASGKDEHEALCAGNIWGNHHSDHITNSILPTSGQNTTHDCGLADILIWADKHNLVCILERKYSLVPDDLRLLRDMGYITPQISSQIALGTD